MAFYTGSKITLGLHACMANALLTKSQFLLLFCVSFLCFVLRQNLTLSGLTWDPVWSRWPSNVQHSPASAS